MKKVTQKMFYSKLNFIELNESYKRAARGKQGRKEIIRFNQKRPEYLGYLEEVIRNGTYTPMPYREFMISEPKPRKIVAAAFIDRIVHRWIVDNFILPVYEDVFIKTTYACLKEKGMHKACLDVFQRFRNKTREGTFYVLKMDVAKYFDNINKNILIEILEKKIVSKDLMNLIKTILDLESGECSLKIGNYTSQTFANIYLNEVDQYAKRELKLKHYFRYLDDTVIFLDTKEEAIETLKKLRLFCRERLHLELNNKTQIFKSTQGINFCGYKINENRLKIRTSGKTHLIDKRNDMLKEINSIENVDITTTKIINKLHSNLNGHFGYIKYANCYNLLNKYFMLL